MKAGDYAGIDAFLVSGQERFLALKYAPFPVVGAAHGLALGGGCETLLHMHEVVAHAELSAGLANRRSASCPAGAVARS